MSVIVKKLLLVLTLLASSAVYAEQGDVWAEIGVAGVHLENNYRANNFNPGLALNYEFIDDLSVGARVYRNSYRDQKIWIDGKYTTPELVSEAAVLDWKFWHNDLWATHVGWTLANHYYNVHGHGVVFSQMKDFWYGEACRKIGDESAKWSACGFLNTWKNANGSGIQENIGVRLQYNFGNILGE